MATSNSSVNISDISKMKVAELKKELKARGLSAVGSKNELVDRLQSASSENNQDSLLVDGNCDAEMLDEDDVLEGVEGTSEFDDEAAEAVLAEEPKEKTEDDNAAKKRGVSQTTEQAAQPKPKKRLIRPPSTTSSKGKENGSQEKESPIEVEGEKTETEKKVIKLTSVSVQERLALRAQKFGLPLSDAAKKQARAERFKATTPVTTDTSKKIVILTPSEEVLKKRAERFGCNVSSTAVKIEEDEKLKKRQERFSSITSAASDTSIEDKKKLRAERFQM